MSAENTGVHADRRQVRVGPVVIGGGAPVSVQTMTKVPTADTGEVLSQIEGLVGITPGSLGERAVSVLREVGFLEEFEESAPVGADFVRCAVPDQDSAHALGDIVRHSPLPIVADIHFDHRLALRAVESGVHKIRINPGNLGGAEKAGEVAKACREAGIPIRVGVNAGSLEKDLRDLFARDPALALVESALRNARMLEDHQFQDIVISLKANSTPLTIETCRRAWVKSDYPLHLGVTEAGIGIPGIVNSTIGLGVLLREGIGDTLRVSLTEDPKLEVVVGCLLARRAARRMDTPGGGQLPSSLASSQ